MSDVQKLDPDDTRPQYLQVADVFRAAIRDNHLRPGEKLPSHAAVADDFAVSVGTVKRAYAFLEADGLIVTRQGQAAHVRTRRPVDAPVDDTADLREAVASLADRVAAIEKRLGDLG